MTNGPEVERTPPEEIERVVSAIWGLVGQSESKGEGERVIFFSSFDPGIPHFISLLTRQGHALHLSAPSIPLIMHLDSVLSIPRSDVCEAIALRQRRYPVWFLSGCGLYRHVDPRRTSIPTALAFAKQKSLTGVVLPAKVSSINIKVLDPSKKCLMPNGWVNHNWLVALWLFTP